MLERRAVVSHVASKLALARLAEFWGEKIAAGSGPHSDAGVVMCALLQ